MALHFLMSSFILWEDIWSTVEPRAYKTLEKSMYMQWGYENNGKKQNPKWILHVTELIYFYLGARRKEVARLWNFFLCLRCSNSSRFIHCIAECDNAMITHNCWLKTKNILVGFLKTFVRGETFSNLSWLYHLLVGDLGYYVGPHDGQE